MLLGTESVLYTKQLISWVKNLFMLFVICVLVSCEYNGALKLWEGYFIKMGVSCANQVRY